MVTGTLVKFEPLKTGEVTVTVACDKSVDLHSVVDMLGKGVSIGLPSLCDVQDNKIAILLNVRDNLERMLEAIHAEIAIVTPEKEVVNAG